MCVLWQKKFGYEGTRCLRAYRGDSVGCELGLRRMHAIALAFECLLAVTATAVPKTKSLLGVHKKTRTNISRNNVVTAWLLSLHGAMTRLHLPF